jgi:uncharacterized integral membrane protein
LAADGKPVVAPDDSRSGVGPLETSVVAFIICALLLLILPATNHKPLGRNVLPTFLRLPSPGQVGAIGYLLLIPVGAAVIAAFVGIPHAIVCRFVHSPFVSRVLDWSFLAAAHIAGLLGAFTIFGG